MLFSLILFFENFFLKANRFYLFINIYFLRISFLIYFYYYYYFKTATTQSTTTKFTCDLNWLEIFLFFFLKMISFVICFLFVSLTNGTPLDDYVNTPDPHYKYELLKSQKLTGYTLHIINMTSQKWLDGIYICTHLFKISFEKNFHFLLL